MITRSLSGIVYVLLVFLCTTNFLTDVVYIYFNIKIQSSYPFYILISLFFIGCMIEAVKILNYKNILFKILTFILAGFIYYNSSKDYFVNSFNFTLYYWKYIMLLILFALSIITLFRFTEELVTDSGKLIFTAVYLGIPFSLTLAIPNSNNPLTSEIFFIFLLIWISDSFAYLVGRKFGKRKLAPKISPNKSIEGLLGGIIFTIITGIIIEINYSQLRGNWIIISILIALSAPIGDLAESKLKRFFKVKDSGNLMPGHGGILDRLDSFIFCIPVIFLYYLINSVL